MFLIRLNLSFLICLGVIGFAGCLSEKESNIDSNTLRPIQNSNVLDGNTAAASNSEVAEDDEQKLSELINLPFVPAENVWRKVEPSEEIGKEKSGLIAVLKLAENDRDSLLAKSARQDGVNEIEVESWFPAGLIARAETSGAAMLKGDRYSANIFTKGHYSSGFFVKVEDTDYIVLFLSAD